MPYSKITRYSKPALLFLAGLWLIAPAVVSAGPAGAQSLQGAIDHRQAYADGTQYTSRANIHLAKIIVLNNDLREAPGGHDGVYQPVAPRLQSRIRKNSEFAAFVKLVRATSKRKYTAEELQKLYLSFKAWSYHNSTTGQ